MEFDTKFATKVRDLIRQGLVSGMGRPVPGQMCIQAVIQHVMGLPHGDDPKECVGPAVRSFGIRLNDAKWSSDQARAKGMERFGLAEIGSTSIDQCRFSKIVSEQTIRQVVPIALRNAARLNPKYAEAWEEAACTCEKEGTKKAARKARDIAADAAAAAAAAAAYAAAAAAADDAAAAAAAYAAAEAADDAAAAAAAAAYAAAEAADASYAADAYAAAYAAYAAYAAAEAAAAADQILALSAEIAVQALIECGSPGCQFLYLTEE